MKVNEIVGRSGQANLTILIFITLFMSCLSLLFYLSRNQRIKFDHSQKQIRCLKQLSFKIDQFKQIILQTNQYLRLLATTEKISLILPGLKLTQVSAQSAKKTIMHYQLFHYQKLKLYYFKSSNQCHWTKFTPFNLLEKRNGTIRRDHLDQAILKPIINVIQSKAGTRTITKINLRKSDKHIYHLSQGLSL